MTVLGSYLPHGSSAIVEDEPVRLVGPELEGQGAAVGVVPRGQDLETIILDTD